VLHDEQLELFRINFGEIILLPKVNEAERIQQYISIYPLNDPLRSLARLLQLYLIQWLSCGSPYSDRFQARKIYPRWNCHLAWNCS
jgi:hypothetical protein